MLRAAFIMAALDSGVPLREVQVPARHADPRTTTVYDWRRQDLDRHAAYVVVAFVAGGRCPSDPSTHSLSPHANAPASQGEVGNRCWRG